MGAEPAKALMLFMNRRRLERAPEGLPLVISALSLELFLELVQKPPVGALRDNLVRSAFNQPGLVQTKGKEAHGVFGIVLAPPAVWHLLHHGERQVIVIHPPAFDDEP